MSATLLAPASFATLSGPATLTLQRLLPGPIERVWQHLVDSELRSQWLAAGALRPEPGASFELLWRNDELSDSPAERPEGFAAESRATCRVTEVEPLRKLGFSWPGVGEVQFELQPAGDKVLLTVTHRQLPDAPMTVMVGAGWHMHCDILVARLQGERPASFWAGWVRLRNEYETILSS